MKLERDCAWRRGFHRCFSLLLVGAGCWAGGALAQDVPSQSPAFLKFSTPVPANSPMAASSPGGPATREAPAPRDSVNNADRPGFMKKDAANRRPVKTTPHASATPAATATPAPSPNGPHEPFLSELGAILSSGVKPLEINVCFAGATSLTEVQLAQAASVSQALALRAGTRTALVGWGPQLAAKKFNVLVGTLDQVRNFVSRQVPDQIPHAYLELQRLRGDKDSYLLLLTGRKAEDVDSAVLSVGFLRVRFPNSPSAEVEEVQLPSSPPFYGREPLRADSTTSFGQLEQGGAGLSQTRAGGISMSLFFPGYLRPQADAVATINLHFLLHARAFQTGGLLSLKLNEQDLSANQAGVHPSENGGSEIVYSFPVRFFQPGLNVLTINPGASSSTTRGPRDPEDELRVFVDSELVLPKLETGPKLPDLQLTSRTFYPFIGQPDGSNLAVLMADRTPDTINGTLTLLARLAQAANTFFYAAQLTFDHYDVSRNLLAVGPYDQLPPSLRKLVIFSAFEQAHQNTPLAELEHAASGVNLKQLIERLLSQRHAANSAAEKDAKVPVSGFASINRDLAFLATAPPLLPGHGWTMLVTASDSVTLAGRIVSLVQPAFWNQLKGDIDRWGADPKSFQAHDPEDPKNIVVDHSVEFPFGERLDFRVWIGGVIVMVVLVVATSSWVLGNMDRMLVLRQRRPR